MAIKTVNFHSIGPFPYDDSLYYAVKTDGKMYVGTAPTAPQDVLRLGDLVTLLGSAVPLSVATASVVGTAVLASREDHVHTNADILGAAVPISVATAAVVGVSALLSRQDHVHPGVDLGSAQTITARKTFQTDLVSPLLIGGVASGGNVTLQSTTHATKGKILFGTSAYDEVNNRLGVALASPAFVLDVSGTVNASGAVTFTSDTTPLALGTGLTPSNAFLTIKQIGTASVRGMQLKHTNNANLGHMGWFSDGTNDATFVDSDNSVRPLRLNTVNNGVVQFGTGAIGIGVAPGAGISRLFFGGTAIATADWVLTSGWGANATISAVTGTDTRGTVTVTTSVLDTPGLNPVITLTFKDGTWTTAPVAVACMNNDSTGAMVAASCRATATTLVITYDGTPAALTAATYIFNYHILG